MSTTHIRAHMGFASLAVAAALAISVGISASAAPQTPRAAPKEPEQKVTPPEARYWMGATTAGGIGAMGGMAGGGSGGRPAMGDMMKMGMGGMPSERRSVILQLGSSLASSKPEPEAFHTMPTGAQVSRPIFLQPPAGSAGDGAPTGYREPKGQITFYWGCGEKVGPGQPVVLTFDKLMRGGGEPELKALQGAVSAREVRKPTPGNSRTYGDWPNGNKRNNGLRAEFPAGATLAGQHVIEGSYSPKIDFNLKQSFMDGVRYTATGALPSGAIRIGWNSVARATGYSLGVLAPQKMDDESAAVVMWSSADRPATFIQNEDLSPAEVKRLIGLKAVLPPEATTCTVPTEVIKATKMGSMLMFTAFGDEATFIHPPRPADPAITWDQEWFARVLFKSVRMDMISPEGVQDMSAMMGGAAASAGSAVPSEEMSDEEYCRQLEEQRANQPSKGEVVGGALGIPGGAMIGKMFGKKKKNEPVDPRCVPK